MPIPTPNPNETQTDFLSRCMGDEMMLEEYPDGRQRYAVCRTQWAGRPKGKAMKKETKDLRFEIKELTESGTFEGYVSVYDVVDAGNDLVEKGAFSKTIAENGSQVPLLWQHNPDEPIGTLELEDDDKGLKVKGSLVLDVERARDAYALLKAGVVRGMSIGYKAVTKKIEEGVRHLKEIRLYEGSLVTFPMNPLAQVTAVKAEEKTDDFDTTLERYRTYALRAQMLNALYSALDDIAYDYDLNADEKIAASDESIQQFHAAYVAFLPNYFALLEKSAEPPEVKAGARISRASRAIIEEAITKLKALLEEEAGDTEEEAGDTEDKSAVATSDPAVATSDAKPMTADYLAKVRESLKVA